MTTLIHYFSAHSQYAYFGFSKLLAVAEKHGMSVEHRPMNLHEVMAAAGSAAFTDRSRTALKYYFVDDARRWAKFRNVEWNGRIPGTHSLPYDKANCFLISAQQQGVDLNVLALAVLRGHWVDGVDLTEVGFFTKLLEAIEVEPDVRDTVIVGLEGAEVLARYDGNTQAAIEQGILGSPSYVIDDEMFYGQDHLEMIDWQYSGN